MTHGSLFSGIGGFDLAAEWSGWENIFHCEWNPFGQKVLKYYWPNAISYHDITKTDFTIHRGAIDILTGGFPCQPYSAAGKRKGKDDDRHLWPEMLRAIREIQPTWVVGENVRGLTNWNGGMVFDEVQADLENEGYEVTPFLLPACAVDAPHRRDRIWFVARHSHYGNRAGYRTKQELHGPKQGNDSFGIRKNISTNTPSKRFRKEGADISRSKKRSTRISDERDVADTNSLIRREGRLHKTEREASERHTCALNSRNDRPTWEDFPTQPPVCNGDDGISARLDGITFPKWRNESIKAGGNAIVPQVAYQIFKAINQYQNQS